MPGNSTHPAPKQSDRPVADQAVPDQSGGGTFAELELEMTKQTLKETEGEFFAIIQAAMDAIMTVDEQQRVVMLNPAAEKMFGCCADDALGRPLGDFLPTRFRCAHSEQVSEFGRISRTSRKMGNLGCLTALRADGTEFPVEIAISQTESKGRKLFTAILRDLTEHNQSVEYAHRLAAIVESSEDAIISKDLSGTILSWNAGAERLYGYRAAEIVGKPVMVLAPPEQRAELVQHLQTIAAGRRVTRHETVRRRKDGSLVEVSLVISPVRDSAGRITGASAIGHDITERKRMQAELARKAEELARSNRDLEQFAYVASHDLQEPLRMVAAYTQLLAERYRGQLDEKADQYIANATDGALRMQALIKDVLAFARVGRNGSTVQSADCNSVLDEALRNLESAINESGAVIDRTALPVVSADPRQLVQVFQNLIGNAIKFQGSVPPAIRVAAEQKGGQWQFSVADNGIGIAEEHATTIFNVFRRLHGRDEYPGNGIGLAICKKVVEQYGGKIWVESQPGRGSSFKFTLPAAARAREQTASQ